MDTFITRGTHLLRCMVVLAVTGSPFALAQPVALQPAPPLSLPPANQAPAAVDPLQPRGVSTAGKWGSFKTDRCTGVGLVQKSAILYDIKGSWEEACYHSGATIDGYTFAHPARCVNTGLAMWGEFDVPDNVCMPNWGGFKKDDCKGVGIRQFSSVLWNIRDLKWEDVCWQMPAVVNGVQFEHPSRCRTTTFGIWGEFDAPDSSCGPVSVP